MNDLPPDETDARRAGRGITTARRGEKPPTLGASSARAAAGRGRSSGSTRAETRSPSHAEAKRAPAAGRRSFIGIDVSKEATRAAPRGLYPLLAVGVVAALAIAAVRVDLLRTRYAVAAALERENELIEAQRQLIVRRRQLRDPVALAVLARERGFRPPTQVVSLPDPPMGRLEAVVQPRPVIDEAAFASASALSPRVDEAARNEWR